MAKFKLEDGTEVEAFTADEVKQQIDNEVAGLKAKRDELLGLHTKDKERLSELEKAQQEAEEDRQKEKGEFKQLYESARAELESERENSRKKDQKIQEEKTEKAIAAVVNDLTRDTGRARHLAREAMEYARYTEDGVKFEIGGVEVDADKMKAKLAADNPFLVDGSGASGGGAQGGSRNGQAGKWADHTPAELSEIRKTDPAKYEHLKTTR